ncbi:tetratricopeptide repeat-containing sensor histidine kinase [Dyadobacter sp. BHUBP1]|uniref:tetratricopeptide repeat-containing sensor histidine kinase n=1 Tax=Dyadobacter sp. BHUBP1 TaxID=3424178 RepID=UPI003D3541EC
MKKCILALLLCTQLANGQSLPDLSRYKTSTEKLQRLAELCDSLYFSQNIDEEKRLATYGLSIAPPADNYNLARFNFFLGVVHENASSLDSSEFYYVRSKKYAYASKNPKRITNVLARLLILYANHLGSTAKSATVLGEALDFIDSTKSESHKVGLFASVAAYYNMLGQYETQVSYLLKGIEAKKAMIVSGAITDREAVVIDLVNLGELYLEQKKSEKAIQYFKEARPYIETTIDYINYYYKRMAEAYLMQGAYGPSKVYFDSLLTLSAKYPKEASVQANVATTMLAYAGHYLERKRPELAYSFVNKAGRIDSKFLTGLDKAHLDLMTGRVLMERGEYVRALSHLESVGKFGYEIGPQAYVSVLETLARCYSKLHRWQDAYLTLEKYVPLRDSLYTESSKKSIADAEAQYQNRAKQAQIEEQQSELSFARAQRMWLIAAAAMGLFIALLLFVIYRNKQKATVKLDAKNRELEEANRTKAKMFSILSHDLRSPISQVYQFLKLQQVNPLLFSESQRLDLGNKVQTATVSLLETMEELLIWSKTQMNAFHVRIEQVEVRPLLAGTLGLLELHSEANQTKITNDVPDNFRIRTDGYFLQTILRNLLQNAIKSAGEKGAVDIGVEAVADEKSVYIENTGAPFTQADFEALLSDDMAPGLHGLGLRLVDDLARKLGATITFSSREHRTRAVIRFPG